MNKLHLCCGKRDFGRDWIHADAAYFPHIDNKLSGDLSNLPFMNDQFDLIYFSHALEYADRSFAEYVLIEINRILKPNGTFRVCVPDFEALSNLYSSGKITLDQMIGPLYGRMQMNFKTIYHKTTYDFISLKNILEKTGYYDIKKYDWRETEHAIFDDHSQAYLPHMDKENGTLISLNVECKKIKI